MGADSGSGDQGSDSSPGGSDTDGSGGRATGSGTGGSGEDSTDGSGGELPSDIEFTYDPSEDGSPATCADVALDSQEIFLDIFVILDRSGSMTRKPQPDGFGDNDPNGYCDIGDPNVGSRWCNAINALHGFFSDPSTVGTGFSYGEFSSTGCAAFSMDVDFGILEPDDANGQLQNLEDALNDDDPSGNTHTEGAIETLIAETTAHAPSGTRRTIGILITDGDPHGCEEDIGTLNQLLVEHYASTGIPTYIVGMTGADEVKLQRLAAGAGSEAHQDYCDPNHSSCTYYSVGDGDPAAFIAALDSIREAELGCEYVVPVSQVGLADLDTLDVQFTPEDGEDAVSLSRVVDEAACPGSNEYWVDTSGSDPIVKLCPATCDLRGPGASVDISLKCEGS